MHTFIPAAPSSQTKLVKTKQMENQVTTPCNSDSIVREWECSYYILSPSL